MFCRIVGARADMLRHETRKMARVISLSVFYIATLALFAVAYSTLPI